MKNKKLIFLDIDGTLTEPGKNIPPDSALEAVGKAREAGHRVFLCSGRNYGSVKPLLAYGFDGAICSAGGYILCGDTVLYDCPLDEEMKNRTLRLLVESGMNLILECFQDSYADSGFKEAMLRKQVIRMDKGSADEQHTEEGSKEPDGLKIDLTNNSELLRWREQAEKNFRILPLEQYDGRPVYKFVILAFGREKFLKTKELLEPWFHFRIEENPPGVIDGELINRKFDKGQAVLRICEYLGVPPEDTIGFGDSPNDLELLAVAGTGVCMENGVEFLKQKADMICPAVTSDGIYKAFEQLGLFDR